jgi:hypothetical protein
MKIINRISLLGFALLALVALNCKKTGITIPPAQAHFVGDATQPYDILVDPVPTYSITVGTTDVSSSDRTISYSITSPSGAVAGTNYSIGGKPGTVVIPAGEATATIDVQGIFAPYTSGRKDTLVFKLETPDVEVAGFQNTLMLILRGPCFDGDVTDIKVMSGTYANSTDPDDPVYTATVNNITALTATTATGKIANLWDVFAPVTINFDWTDPLNTKVSIPLQPAGIDYDAGQPFLIRTSPGQANKFSVCNEKITLIVDLIVDNYFGPGQGAYYEQNYPMTIRR